MFVEGEHDILTNSNRQDFTHVSFYQLFFYVLQQKYASVQALFEYVDIV